MENTGLVEAQELGAVPEMAITACAYIVLIMCQALPPSALYLLTTLTLITTL